MRAADVLAGLRARGFTLTPAGDRLAVAPAAALTEADRVTIRAHKAELLRILAGPAAEGDAVYLLGPDGITHNLMEAWTIAAIVRSDDGPLAVFVGRPYGSWPLSYCRKAGGAK